MSEPGATPIFVDTGAFYARADEDDKHHDTATRVFKNIRSGEVAYRPVYTSRSVLAELATLALYKLDHSDAVRVLNAIRDSGSITSFKSGGPRLRLRRTSLKSTTTRRSRLWTTRPAYSRTSGISSTSSRSTETFAHLDWHWRRKMSASHIRDRQSVKKCCIQNRSAPVVLCPTASSPPTEAGSKSSKTPVSCLTTSTENVPSSVTRHRIMSPESMSSDSWVSEEIVVPSRAGSSR